MLNRIPYAACPLCGDQRTAAIVTADCSRFPFYQPSLSPVMTWLQCAGCDHVYTDGFHSREALDVLFSGTHAAQTVGFDLENQRYVWARVIEKLLPFADAGHWLDVGFGNGALLFTAHEFGFTPVGIDLRKNTVAALQASGIEAHATDLADLKQPARFDVISMCDVLEHMPYPAAGLQHVHALLKDDGVLFLSIPNSDSALWKSLNAQNANPYWAELEHYHNFSRQRLYRLLAESGFEAVRYGVSERYRVCMDVIARKRK